jgi:hypothetical protein
MKNLREHVQLLEKEDKEIEQSLTNIMDLPPEVLEVFTEFRTCEFTTLSRKGTPITWPMDAIIKPPESEQFVFCTSIGLPQKAFNMRRNPSVSFLFSDPTGSGLEDPPYVLVQGDAEVPDELHAGFPGTKEMLSKLVKRQPAGSMFCGNPIMRYLMDWYYMRLFIYVTPRRVLWWDHGDFTSKPKELVISNVG